LRKVANRQTNNDDYISALEKVISSAACVKSTLATAASVRLPTAVYHKCNPGSMEMYVAPIVGSGDRFVGNVYIMGHEDDDRCVFGRHGNDDETFYSLIRFDECGGAVNHTDVSIPRTDNVSISHWIYYTRVVFGDRYK